MLIFGLMISQLLKHVAGKERLITPISPAEKQFRLEEALKQYPALTNPNIWLCIIQAVDHQRRQKGILESEIQLIVAAYRNTHTQGDIPVGELLTVAAEGHSHPIRNPFLQRVCFNYDWEFEGEQRRQEAYQQFQEEVRRGEPHHYGLDWSKP